MGGRENIRIIIVDDIAETRENVRKLLQFESDFEVIGVAKTGREGIQLAKETNPDVTLMDINMPDIDGISATETIRRDVAFTQIVILSVQGDPNYMRRAMQAGACDYLTKPPAVDELVAAVRRAGRLAHEERNRAIPIFQTTAGVGGTAALVMPTVIHGKIIVVYSPKGGTGCTTLATNLAVALHSSEIPVALVDGNLQFGDVAVFLNEQSKNSVVDLAPRADELDTDIINEVMVTHSASGVKLLAAPFRPEYAENVTGEQFGKILKFLRRMFAYIVIDTASSLTDVTLVAIDNADLIILITTQEIPSIKNARLFLDLLEVLNIQRERVLFVMNRFDKRIGISPEKIGESFKHGVVGVIPFDDRVVIPSVNRGIPFVLDDRSKIIARSLLSLVDVIRQRLSELEPIIEPVAAGKTSKYRGG